MGFAMDSVWCERDKKEGSLHSFQPEPHVESVLFDKEDSGWSMFCVGVGQGVIY